MDKTISHRLPGTGRKATIEDAFLAAFPKTKKYPRSTFYKYRGIWRNSEWKVRLGFIDLGNSEEATFGHFLAALSNPHLLPNANESSDSSSPDPEEEPEKDANGLPSAGHDLMQVDDGDTVPAWPVSVDLDSLPDRILNLQDLIEEIYGDPLASNFFQGSRSSYVPQSSCHADSMAMEYFSAEEQCAG